LIDVIKRRALAITLLSLRILPAGKNEIIVFDSDIHGFGVRLRAGGHRSFVFQYKLGAKHRRISIGSVAAVSLSAARDTAKDLYAAVRLGRDPAGEKQHAKSKAGETFEATAAQYLDHARRALRPRSFDDVNRHLLKHAKSLHRLRLEKISRRDIASCLASVRAHAGRIAGNRFRTSLSGFFSWTIEQGIADTNPVTGTTRVEETSRDRVLSLDELRAIWDALPDNSDYSAILKLLMLTGARAGESAGLRRDEICDSAVLLPAARTKNHREHRIPLSATAAAIVTAALKRHDAKRNLVFGQGVGPFSGWSNCKEALDRRIAEMVGKPLAPWRIHDLRRSFATHAAGIGIQPHIVEAVLNHVSGYKGGVAGIYNRAAYEPEKRTALDRWAAYLLAAVEARHSNVTPLRAGN
jgi:integrase